MRRDDYSNESLVTALFIVYMEIVAVAIHYGGLILGGLMLDVGGAFILAWTELRPGATMIAKALQDGEKLGEIIRGRQWYLQVAACFAALTGSRDATEADQTISGAITPKFWGIVLLLAGFVLQGIGVFRTWSGPS